MKIYVVSAGYCEDTVICGAALDERTADRIAECEKAQEIKPNWVGIDVYNTDDYFPLIAGLNPYSVMFYENEEYGSNVIPTSLSGFVHNYVVKSIYDGKRCLRCDVYAMGKEHALKLATILKDQYFSEIEN